MNKIYLIIILIFLTVAQDFSQEKLPKH